jgi:hypothetical protein
MRDATANGQLGCGKRFPANRMPAMNQLLNLDG